MQKGLESSEKQTVGLVSELGFEFLELSVAMAPLNNVISSLCIFATFVP